MKGVIVQVGEPKSIVLFNNGKVSRIPTPLEDHVGMVGIVKLNNRIKIIGLVTVVVVLIGIGIVLGFLIEKNLRLKNRQMNASKQKGEREMKGDGMRHVHDISEYGYLKGKEENEE